MATTVFERRNALNDIWARLTRQKNAIEGAAPIAKTAVDRAKADLDDIPVSLKKFIDDMAADSSANPGSLLYGPMNEEAVKALEELSALSGYADTVSKYIDQVPPRK